MKFIQQELNEEVDVDLGNSGMSISGYAILETPDKNVTVTVLTFYYEGLLRVQIIVNNTQNSF